MVDAWLMIIVRAYGWSRRTHFCLERRPIVQLWLNVSAQPLNHPRCMARSCWHSIDAQYWNIVAMLSQPYPNRNVGYRSLMNECRSETIFIFHNAMAKMVDAPLMHTFELTLVTYPQWLGAQQLYMKSTLSFLAASISFLCIIMQIQNCRDITFSEAPLYTSFA